ncbi:MAG: CRTAC1 family protein [Acidobacteriota bacterium]
MSPPIPGSSVSSDRAVQFVDVSSEAGIDFRHHNGSSEDKFLVETFGSGVAWIDYDNDGFLDLYFVNSKSLAEENPSPGNVLYRNSGKGTFLDVTKTAGVSGNGGAGTGVAVGDYDNDGFLDLFVTYYGPNILYRNNGDGTFSDSTSKAGVAGGNSWSSSAGFFDYDRDGDLDLYVVNYLDYHLDDNPYCGFEKEGYRMYCHPTTFDGSPDQLFRNNGDGTFTDVSAQAGIANPAGKGLGVTFADLDQDGYPDIYIANDTVRNFLYRNSGDGTFEDITYRAGAGYDPNGKPQAGMGTDSGDFDGDGLLDLFVTNFSEELNALYRNVGDFFFEDVSQESGLESSFKPLGFGTKLLDFDNDGDLDIYVTNGHVIDNVELYSPHLSYLQTDLLYENSGGEFEDISSLAGAAFQIEHVGRGAAVGDYDNDGDLDIALSNCGGRAMLFRNDGGNRNHWITIKAQGKNSNRFGLGAKVRLETAHGTQYREINNVASYLSSNDIRLHFGLGSQKTVEKIEILWPSGTRQILTDIPADKILLIEEALERPPRS